VSRPAAVESLRRASFLFTPFDPTYREGGFVTEVLECDTRMAGDVEKAVLGMYLSGISVKNVAGVTKALGRVEVAKDPVTRSARRLEEEQ
jgi:transposase-like protein